MARRRCLLFRMEYWACFMWKKRDILDSIIRQILCLRCISEQGSMRKWCSYDLNCLGEAPSWIEKSKDCFSSALFSERKGF